VEKALRDESIPLHQKLLHILQTTNYMQRERDDPPSSRQQQQQSPVDVRKKRQFRIKKHLPD